MSDFKQLSRSVKGLTVLVTGAASGMGRATARVFAAEGANVAVADFAAEGARAVAAEIAGRGQIGKAWTLDVADRDEIKAVVGDIVGHFGGLDIVVNNAAILRDGFIFKADPLAWDAVMRTNLSAPFHILAAATPVMREQTKSLRGGTPYSWGRIVNIVSTAGLYGNYGQAAYASAKAGLLGLTRVVALDMQRSLVTCNAVAPFAATRVTESIKPANPAQASYKERAMKVPARAVAELVAWLAGPEAASVSGQLFGVRGREVFLFSQPRPAARMLSPGLDGLGAAIAKDLAPHYLPLSSDLEAFSDEPVL
jgi:NAD(P)-dependent dehydrogenase (short-subunit alcohol dehydrogenase family)